MPRANANAPSLGEGTGRRVVAVGASAGGLKALGNLLRTLPPDFGSPIVIVLHRGADLEALSAILGRDTPLSVVEAEDKMEVRAGTIYVAPGDYHLLACPDGTLALSVDPPVNYSRPSIDVLFETAAEAWGARAIGVLLTGSSRDGASGLARIKGLGGLALVQDPGDAEAPTMPRAALELVSPDFVGDLAAIGRELARLCPPIARADSRSAP